MKLGTKRRLNLEKHTLRMLLERDLANAHGAESGVCETSVVLTCILTGSTCDSCVCFTGGG